MTISSGDNFLAGLNLRASFQRFGAGLRPFYDSDAIAQLGYDAVTIGIVGISPPETPTISAPRIVTFSDEVAAVKDEAAALTQVGVNKIIVSSHLQDSARERALTARSPTSTS